MDRQHEDWLREVCLTLRMRLLQTLVAAEESGWDMDSLDGHMSDLMGHHDSTILALRHVREAVTRCRRGE